MVSSVQNTNLYETMEMRISHKLHILKSGWRNVVFCKIICGINNNPAYTLRHEKITRRSSKR